MSTIPNGEIKLNTVDVENISMNIYPDFMLAQQHRPLHILPNFCSNQEVSTSHPATAKPPSPQSQAHPDLRPLPGSWGPAAVQKSLLMIMTAVVPLNNLGWSGKYVKKHRI